MICDLCLPPNVERRNTVDRNGTVHTKCDHSGQESIHLEGWLTLLCKQT